MKYREQKLELGKQGTIFLYTDGVTEAENPEEEMFGEQRLKAVLDRCAPEEDPKGIISRISMAVKEFSVEKGAVQTDDITMLCVRHYAGKKGMRDKCWRSGCGRNGIYGWGAGGAP